jgi:hypothetical protein
MVKKFIFLEYSYFEFVYFLFDMKYQLEKIRLKIKLRFFQNYLSLLTNIGFIPVCDYYNFDIIFQLYELIEIF